MPRMRRMSWGLKGPEVKGSPACTSWPSCTMRCAECATRYSRCSCSSQAMVIFLLRLLRETRPEMLANITSAVSSFSEVSSPPLGRAKGKPACIQSPFSTTGIYPLGGENSSWNSSEFTTRMRLPSRSSSTSTLPSISERRAIPLGERASKSSSTLGRPLVMSIPATPPVWKVRMVSWVPGSPILCAAKMPTASPRSTSLPVAGLRP